MMLSSPALAWAGLDEDRFKEMFEGAPCSPDEQETLRWGYEMLDFLLGANKLGGTILETRLTAEAVEIARMRLDSDSALAVVEQMRNFINEFSTGG